MLTLWCILLCLEILKMSTVYSECNDGGLTLYRDMYIVENIKTDVTDETRPHATLPPGLSIRPSSIPGAGLGVWTERDFPKGTRFGPYGGVVTYHLHEWQYAWLIYDLNNNIKHYVDAYHKNSSNWLRYIDCARTVDEENLYLYQLNDKPYYVSYECIKSGTELLIWYGPDYGVELGLKRTAEDYKRRFNEDDTRYIIENKLYENVSRLNTKCYKFYNRPPFKKPPGKLQRYDRYCFNDGRYQVCKYKKCDRNPCTSHFDCETCPGYCLHLGRYKKTGATFYHADNVNTCICHTDGHSGCTINRQSLDKMCN